MTLFEPIPPVRDRALAMPHMATLLHHVADRHESLAKTITRDSAERAIPCRSDNKELYVNAAMESGFLDAEGSHYGKTTGLWLTAEGYAVIGRDVPMWRQA